MPDGGEVRALVVDDNPITRMGLRAVLSLSNDVVVVGEAATASEAVQQAVALQPDVVLLDVNLDEPGDGIDVAEVLAPRTRVVMLTLDDSDATIRRALLAGAVGYIVHGAFDPEELAASLVGAARGTGTFSPKVVETLRMSLAAPPPEKRRPEFGLTEREIEIMDLIAQGLPNDEIARRCYVAPKTVKNHVTNIFSKLNVKSRAEAVSLWLRWDQTPR